MSGAPAPGGAVIAGRMAKALLMVVWAAVPRVWAGASDFEFHAPAAVADATTPAIMRDLAERILPVYQESDPDRYLANLSALQMVAGDYAAAYVSRQSLRDRRRSEDAGRPAGRSIIYDIYAHARAMEAERRVTFAEGFANSYRDEIPRLSDQNAYEIAKWFETPLPMFRDALQKSFDQQRVKDSIGQAEAVDLIWKYLSYDAHRNFGPLVDLLDAGEDRRRYTSDGEIVIKGRNGASIFALVIRPKNPSAPLPALLEFTIADSQNYAKECAAHGYIGVVAYVRGKQMRPRGFVPYQHDAQNARAVIDWIAKQSWSDGRVGMYGDGYSGFVSWAAAKLLPPALKAIATSNPSAPGIDVPLDGGIFQNSAYRWSLCATSTKASVANDCRDDELWRSLDQKWYRSGRRYRDFGRVHRQPNPIFIRWLNHPSYDRYWQSMVPYQKQFARINIPVLTTTGYYAAREPGALYYFAQHYRYNPHADHTLVIGPYDDGVMQNGPSPVLHGYQLDSAALVDLHDLRYQWFDHVFKGGATPSLLKDRVNYEVMGEGEWRHAPSLDAMATGSLRFYLGASSSGDSHRLTQRKPLHPTFALQSVGLADRRDAGWMPPADLISTSLAIHNGVMFVSEPLAKPTEFNGLFSGRLDFTVNKMDLDLYVTLYELQAGGDYIRLFGPSYEFRASYAKDRVHRHLLKAGERQQLTFKSERLASRLLPAGSRLVMVLGINKRPDREINYGTGNDVSEESIADGRIPVKVRWYGDSYIDIPVRR